MIFMKFSDISVNRLSLVFRSGHRWHVFPKNNTLFTFQRYLNRNYCRVLTQNQRVLKNCNEFNVLNKYSVLSPNLMSVRSLAKGKDRPKEKKKGVKPKVVLTDEEMSELVPINELKIELNNLVNKFKTDLISNVSVRSNPQSIENLLVEINGLRHPLSEVANIARKSPQLIVLNLSSMPDAVKPVMKAIAESGMNLSPQQEGTAIYLPIPKVTREHREGLANNARALCNRAKEDLRHIHSSFSNYVKKQKKSHVSEELIFNVNENLKFLIDTKAHELDEIMEQKLKELLN